MKARIQWAGEAMFLGESGSGHVVVMDGPPESGGRNLGVRPMEMLLLGLGGCSNFDVVSILKKSRQPVESCEAFLEAERATEDPKVFTKIHLHFVQDGSVEAYQHFRRMTSPLGGVARWIPGNHDQVAQIFAKLSTNRWVGARAPWACSTA